MLGPLYHLPSRRERLQSLGEAKRILKRDGVALIAYLNAWGLIKTGVTDFPERYTDPAFLQSLLGTGAGLAIWSWSNPELARDEIREAGFEVLTYAGAEGFLAGMAPLVETLARDRPAAYAEAVKIAAESSELPQYRDATDHLIFATRRPSG
jgi:hypothetical protein